MTIEELNEAAGSIRFITRDDDEDADVDADADADEDEDD